MILFRYPATEAPAFLSADTHGLSGLPSQTRRPVDPQAGVVTGQTAMSIQSVLALWAELPGRLKRVDDGTGETFFDHGVAS